MWDYLYFFFFYIFKFLLRYINEGPVAMTSLHTSALKTLYVWTPPAQPIPWTALLSSTWPTNSEPGTLQGECFNMSETPQSMHFFSSQKQEDEAVCLSLDGDGQLRLFRREFMKLLLVGWRPCWEEHNRWEIGESSSVLIINVHNTAQSLHCTLQTSKNQ